jgi:prepilin-type N-terminal cleavage/methylation domain-containing protein/prepilin-type processing-associated H-X9-DG protein
MSASPRRGFTLIELLVVIAIIAILASILFPVFAKARGKARQAACMSNLRQIDLGLKMYSDDYDEMMPLWSLDGGNPDGSGRAGLADPYTWDKQINPYLKNTQILICRDNPYGTSNRSYALPRYVARQALGMMDNVTEIVFLYEKGAYPPGSWEDATGENFHDSTDPLLAPKYFHQDGKNLAFADGHVKWYQKTAGPFAETGRPGASPGAWAAPGEHPTGDWPTSD